MNRWLSRNDLTPIVVDGAPMISVLSGKGGVGKSSLAFNLAEQMTSLGRRVLLVDADVAGGNLHIFANQPTEVGIGHVLADQLSLSEAIVPVSPRLDLLGSTGFDPDFDPNDVQVAGRFVRQLKENSLQYHVIVVDHGPGVCRASAVMAHASAVNLLVVIPELTSISDSYGLFKYLRELNRKLVCRLLINRIQSGEHADYISSKFAALAERFIGSVPELIGTIPEDAIFRQALARQRPISALKAESSADHALRRLTHAVLEAVAPTGLPPVVAIPERHNENPATADTRG